MTLPKLHIRDLFWLVLVVACLCAWYADRSQLVYRYDEYIRQNINFKHLSIGWP